MSFSGIDVLIAIGGFSCTLIGTWIGVSKYYHGRLDEYVRRQTEASTKAYAAERDFGHIKRNLEQLQQGQMVIHDDFERRLDKVETRLTKLDMFISVIAARSGGGAISTLFNPGPDQE